MNAIFCYFCVFKLSLQWAELCLEKQMSHIVLPCTAVLAAFKYVMTVVGLFACVTSTVSQV